MTMSQLMAIAAVLVWVPAVLALWMRLRALPVRRRVVNMLYPLAQMGVAVFAASLLLRSGAAVAWVAGLLVLSVASAVLTVALFSSILDAEAQGFETARARALAETAAEQERHLDAWAVEARPSASLRESFAAPLRELQRALAAGDERAARAALGAAGSVIPARGDRLSENVAVDALLQVKRAALAERGIELEAAADVPAHTESGSGALAGVTDAELCAVLGNLIDNAGHAVAELPARERRIEVTAGLRQGLFVVRVCNPVTPGVALPDAGAGLPARSGDQIPEHGWGVPIVAAIAHRHGGSLSYELTDGCLAATVLLNCK